MSSPLVVSPEVAHALDTKRPVVALETTLVTHGFPHPEGLRIAAELEAEVRSRGAIPATVGVLGGNVRVGLRADELERLATTASVVKLNTSNFAACVAEGGTGSTTVSATLLIAHRAGIEVLSTGGIGGVHRDAQATGDVSADLGALGRFPVATVCSGAKAVLDLPRTLEALETLGVPVYGLGTDQLPAFYRRESGLPLDRRFDDFGALAAAIRVHFRFGSGTGVLVANPVSAEHELPRDVYENALAGALADASAAGVRGRGVTPFLLERLRLLTEGATVFSNRALLLGNARAAAALAVALAHS